MAQQQKKEERFRYIGFDVYPSKPESLIKETDEEQKYFDKIKKKGESWSALDRDFSLVNIPAHSPSDKLILTVFSLLLVLSFFLPWFSYKWGEQIYSFSALTALLNVGKISDFIALGGSGAVSLTILCAVFMILCLAAGIVNLLTLFSKSKGLENYWKKVGRWTKLGYLPIVTWVAVLIISMVGFRTPLWDLLGVSQLGEKFGIVNLISLTGAGLWLAFAALVVSSSVIREG